MTTTYQKVQRACAILNHEAYKKQSSKGKVKQFTPCAKAESMINDCREERAFLLILANADNTQCDCHRTLTQNQLFDMCFDGGYQKTY